MSTKDHWQPVLVVALAGAIALRGYVGQAGGPGDQPDHLPHGLYLVPVDPPALYANASNTRYGDLREPYDWT